MINRIAFGTFAFLALTVFSVNADENLKSGIPVGKQVRAFHPLNVTGPAAGEKRCLVCSNGNNPVAVIFARKLSDPLTTLVKKIDAATVKNKSANMGSFVVFLNDDESLSDSLKSMAKKQGLSECILSIDNPAGPSGFDIAADAEVTVLFYNRRTVRANHAFGAGELNNQSVERVVADLKTILE